MKLLPSSPRAPAGRNRSAAGLGAARASGFLRRLRAGFTLIEIMIVVALIGLICTTAIPSIYQLSKKGGLRRAISDLRDVFDNARRRAVFGGKEVTVMFHPQQRTFYIADSGGAINAETGESKPQIEAIPGKETTGIIPDDVVLELLDVNKEDYLQAEWTRVRFFYNGTCDEFTVAFRTDSGEVRWLTLDPCTALLTQSSTRP